MPRIVNLGIWIGLLLAAVTVGVVGCKQKAKTEKQTKINFGTGHPADDEMDALSSAVMRAVEEHAPQFDVVSVDNLGRTVEVIQNLERYDICGINLDEAAHAYYGFFAWERGVHHKGGRHR